MLARLGNYHQKTETVQYTTLVASLGSNGEKTLSKVSTISTECQCSYNFHYDIKLIMHLSRAVIKKIQYLCFCGENKLKVKQNFHLKSSHFAPQ